MMVINKIEIEVEINKQVEFRKFPQFEKILNIASNLAIKTSGVVKNKKYSISLLLCDETEILRLNNEFRCKNYVTNVLSFEDGDILEGILYLGDIAMCIPKIKEEADIEKKTFKTHFVHLFIHGVLHLLGFDHETQQEQVEMEGLEDKILEELTKELQ